MPLTRVKTQDVADGTIATADLADHAVTPIKCALDSTSIEDNGSAALRVKVDGKSVTAGVNGLLAPGRDAQRLLANGQFRYWQRNGTAGASLVGAVSAYIADRWKSFGAAGGTCAVSAAAIAVGTLPGDPPFSYHHVQSVATTGGNQPGVEQRIEGVDTFQSTTVTFSFYAKAAAGTPAIVLQPFFDPGTGGAPTAETSAAASQSVTISTAWVRYSLTYALGSTAGFTKGTNANDYLRLVWQFPAGTTYTIDLANVQVDEGSVAAVFNPIPPAEDLQLCLRYYFKTYDLLTAPGTASAANGMQDASSASTTAGVGVIGTTCFPVIMRAPPTVTVYSFAGVSGKMTQNGGAEITAGGELVGQRAASVANSASAVTGTKYFWHLTADAEL